jgi:hypothetical protein
MTLVQIARAVAKTRAFDCTIGEVLALCDAAMAYSDGCISLSLGERLPDPVSGAWSLEPISGSLCLRCGRRSATEVAAELLKIARSASRLGRKTGHLSP